MHGDWLHWPTWAFVYQMPRGMALYIINNREYAKGIYAFYCTVGANLISCAMFQVKLGLGLATSAIGAWCASVYIQRNGPPPTGSRAQFTPGSAGRRFLPVQGNQ